jgi:siroheme synthase-like protein
MTMANSYLPVSINVSGRPCLVVGGGNVALRKVETLLDFGAAITVISPDPDDKLIYFGNKKLLELKIREYQSPEAVDYRIVISASDNKEINKQVSVDCRENGTLLNVVDNPQLCSFIFPAVLKRDAMTVAVSTSGEAPFLAGRIKLILSEIFPERWSRIVKLAGTFRRKVRERHPENPDTRGDYYNKFLDLEWKEMLSKMTDEEVNAELERILDDKS